MIEGEYAPSNPILSYAQPTEFALGADIASASGYPAGQLLFFDIDLTFFPNPYAPIPIGTGSLAGQPTDVPQPQFRWDFGDGTGPQIGTLVSHAYEKPGTYMIDLSVRYPEKQTEFASVDTIQIDIVPHEGYEKNQPKIYANGTIINNPARDIVAIAPAKPVTLVAEGEGATPVEYVWDFGNEEGATGKSVTTRYSRDNYFPVVVLRTIDEHGLWTDTYALLDLPLGSPNPLVRLWYVIVDFVTLLITR